MPRSKTPLTEKQERFVAEYLIDQNGAQAAIRAGYSERSARKIASELLTKPEVRKAVNAGKKHLAAKLELSAEKVLADIDRIATKAEKARRYGDALKGRELLGKHMKLFTEKHEHGGIGGGPIQMQVSETEAKL
jgi:phage terminase small subunit